MICNNSCGKLLESKRDDENIKHLGKLRTNTATLHIKRKGTINSFKMALEEVKYGPKIAKHLGLTRQTCNNIDWKAHIIVAKGIYRTATTKLV